MRRLHKDDSAKATKILTAATAALQKESNGRFNIENDHVRIADGIDEAIYAWVAWHYDNRSQRSLRGVLEMGGASMQVAFPWGGKGAPELGLNEVGGLFSMLFRAVAEVRYNSVGLPRFGKIQCLWPDVGWLWRW